MSEHQVALVNSSLSAQKKGAKGRGHTRPQPVSELDLSQPGWLRVGHMLTLFCVGHSTLYQRIKAGLIPPPDGRDARPYWQTSTVLKALKGE